MLWIGGRAIVISGSGYERPVAQMAASKFSEPRTADRRALAIPTPSILSMRKPLPTPLPMEPRTFVSAQTIETPIATERALHGRRSLAIERRRGEQDPIEQRWPPEHVNLSGVAEASLVTQPSGGFGTHRRMAISGYIFIRGTSRDRGLSGNAILGGSQMALFAEGPHIAAAGGFAIRPFARITSERTQTTPQEMAIGITASKRAAPFVYSASLERRTRVSDGGRNALAARVTMGLYSRINQTPLTLSGYGQAGIVGLNRKDGFAEGEILLSATEGNRFDRARPGIGIWTGIQPRAARIDIGPTLDIPLLRGPIPVAVRTSWRFRVGGNAVPGSGPVLIVSTGF
jgi:hypothetical protein